MKNFVQEGKTLTFTAPTGGVVSGGAYLVGGVVAIAAADAAETEEFEGVLEGAFTLDKVTGTAWTAGDRLYWDNSTKKATKVAGGNTLMGIAGSDAASGATTGVVRLNGSTDEAYAGGAAETLDPLTENAGAIGGTNDGDLPALVDPAGDAGASVIAGIRENAEKINKIITALTNLGLAAPTV